jgi:galactose mutarotase-like enzyme
MKSFQNRCINVRQVGGIDRYTLDDGAGRGVRVACFDTGANLRFRVLIDRGLDVDHCTLGAHSLAFLTHRGVTAPSDAHDRGADWLRSFPGGLLTTCGPFSTGAPSDWNGTHYPLHGPHSNSSAELVSVVQPTAQSPAMSVTGLVRYGAFYGPNAELRRTISTSLGSTRIDFVDVVTNVGNETCPHAWLLHINFGWPILDAGSRFVYRATRSADPRPDEDSRARFGDPNVDHTVFPPPDAKGQRGSRHAFAYVHPKPDRDGTVTCGLVNDKLGLSATVRYDTSEFPRLGNWQHWGAGEYVAALEPMTGGVEGIAVDAERGWLRYLKPGESRTYRYSIEAKQK